MVSKEKIRQLIDSKIESTDIVLVDLQVNTANLIKVQLDSFDGVAIDKCVEISRLIEGSLDREIEDFELEVSSYGIAQPFTIPLHYLKNINREVEVFLKDGKSLKGILKTVELNENKDVAFVEIANKKKIKTEGKKKKIEVEEVTKVAFDEIQKAKLVPIF